MSESTEDTDLRRANFRLCRLCVWPNYGGLGFNLENASVPPHIIRTVESNSPAAAGGLKILDLLLAVNNQDVSTADYKTVTQAIKDARDSNNRIELLVIERRFYEIFKIRGFQFNPKSARIIETPATMPQDYVNFPKNIPRTCEIRLTNADQSFGFEIINGMRDIGAFIQEIVPGTPASRTSLRKSDRILEIDDKFVDAESGRSILDKLAKAKTNRSVKLYVVDTSTYKYFQENKIPLPSKEFRKSKFARQQQQQPPASTYINVEDISTEPRIGVNIPRSTYLAPTPVYNPQPNISEIVTRPESHQDDIRLCTINRANATDPYGIELNFHKRELYHTLKVTIGRDDASSNAALAGVKTNDHLIEINGENIENTGDEEVKRRIRDIKYPQPLQILVADSVTYNYYKQQNKVIHSGLPSVRRLPGNIVDRFGSPPSTHRESSALGTTVFEAAPAENPSSSLTGLVNNNPIDPRISMENSQLNRRNYKLFRIQGFSGYGFSVNSNQGGNISHKITQIAPYSPAAQQGLRVGDYILTVNDKNVEKMSAYDFNQFLRTSAQNAETHGNPLVLEVINEDSYQPSALPDEISLRNSTTEPPSTIPSINGNIIRQSSYYNPIEPIGLRNGSRKSSGTQPTPSRNDSQRSAATQPKISRNESRKLPAPTPPITPRDETRKLSTTQQMIAPDVNRKSTTNQPPSSRNENQKSTVNQPYTNGYNSSPRNQSARSEIRRSEASSSLYRSRDHLSRGTVDVVSKNRLLRYCRLSIEPGQPFGFQLKTDDDKHIVYNIQPDSPAARAGLNENDHLIEVDDQNIEHKSNKEVTDLIRNGTHNGTLRLFISPNSIKVLSKRSAKSLSEINDDFYYRSKYNDQDQSSSSSSKYRSIPRLHGEQIYNRTEPTDPLPRKCVLQHDSSFPGCGFRLIEKDDYDTPIITEITPNSPAQRSGLTVGDHIIYIDSQNVQNFRSFNDITSLIKRTFEENGEITLITLTGPGYQVLKRRGGYLESLAFDYQTSNIDQLKPRLFKLKLSNHEQDFGFNLHRNNCLFVKSIEQNSSAYINGLKINDIVLELNGKNAKYLTLNQIKEIIDISKQERKLDILVIDINGYQFSMKHAIPLNSLLSFVQPGEGRTTIGSIHFQKEPVSL